MSSVIEELEQKLEQAEDEREQLIDRVPWVLVREILKLSEAKTWKEAKLEWKCFWRHHVREPQRCLCGHYPINEICVLTNTLNHHQVEIGNVCVKKFPAPQRSSAELELEKELVIIELEKELEALTGGTHDHT